MGYKQVTDHQAIKDLQLLFAMNHMDTVNSMKYCNFCKEKWFEGKKVLVIRGK